ncbi:hypothetical protein ACLB6G_18760 [Zhengella sp. ZM62]|uniref:hypothetical protein n=1 Tax=Zhengella sedimenti TaxID=3390035 RepID=UPI0039752ABE
MRVLVDFYRTRAADDAHAVVGRETVDVADIDGAIEAARNLLRTLDMPQQPDAVTITDESGRTLYSGELDGETMRIRKTDP